MVKIFSIGDFMFIHLEQGSSEVWRGKAISRQDSVVEGRVLERQMEGRQS